MAGARLARFHPQSDGTVLNPPGMASTNRPPARRFPGPMPGRLAKPSAGPPQRMNPATCSGSWDTFAGQEAFSFARRRRPWTASSPWPHTLVSASRSRPGKALPRTPRREPGFHGRGPGPWSAFMSPVGPALCAERSFPHPLGRPFHPSRPASAPHHSRIRAAQHRERSARRTRKRAVERSAPRQRRVPARRPGPTPATAPSRPFRRPRSRL